MRCNEAVFSTKLHDEINLDEAKGCQQLPLKDLTVQNDYFSDHFSKDYYVTFICVHYADIIICLIKLTQPFCLLFCNILH